MTRKRAASRPLRRAALHRPRDDRPVAISLKLQTGDGIDRPGDVQYQLMRRLPRQLDVRVPSRSRSRSRRPWRPDSPTKVIAIDVPVPPPGMIAASRDDIVQAVIAALESTTQMSVPSDLRA